jgi:hypothetical protein
MSDRRHLLQSLLQNDSFCALRLARDRSSLVLTTGGLFSCLRRVQESSFLPKPTLRGKTKKEVDGVEAGAWTFVSKRSMHDRPLITVRLDREATIG